MATSSLAVLRDATLPAISADALHARLGELWRRLGGADLGGGLLISPWRLWASAHAEGDIRSYVLSDPATRTPLAALVVQPRDRGCVLALVGMTVSPALARALRVLFDEAILPEVRQ